MTRFMLKVYVGIWEKASEVYLECICVFFLLQFEACDLLISHGPLIPSLERARGSKAFYD